MKVKFICAAFVCALISVATLNIYLNQQENTSLSSLALANLEALANGEGGNTGGGENNPPGGGENGVDDCHWYNYGSEGRTDPCKLELGGGWFTGSVMRVCITTPDASKTCTPKACGEVF